MFSELPHVPDLQRSLDRWVAAGLISTDQAGRIAAAESLPQSQPHPHPQSQAAGSTEPQAAGPTEQAGFLAAGRGGFVVEALGYLGGTLAAVAGFIAVGQLWPDIPDAAEMAFAAAGALLLLVTGVLVQVQADPALMRLRSVLWALSAGCVAALVALLGDRLLGLTAEPAGVLTAGVTAVYAGLLWLRLPTPIQHLVMFVAVLATVGTAVSAWDDGPGLPAMGVAVWVTSVAWAALALRRVVTPQLTGAVAASAGVLLGAQLTLAFVWGNLLALATVAALLAAGAVLRQVWLLGFGAFGVLIVVPQVATRYLPETVAAPLAVLLVGVLLLAIAVWLSRSRRLHA